MAKIEIDKLELLVLKKLAIVNLALAKQLSGAAGREQKALTSVLCEIVNRAEPGERDAR